MLLVYVYHRYCDYYKFSEPFRPTLFARNDISVYTPLALRPAALVLQVYMSTNSLTAICTGKVIYSYKISSILYIAFNYIWRMIITNPLYV